MNLNQMLKLVLEKAEETGKEGLPLIAQFVQNLPEMQETLVQFLGQEDPLAKG